MIAEKKTHARHNVSNLHRGLDIMELLLENPEGLGISDNGVTNGATASVFAGQFGQTIPNIGGTPDANALEQILGTSIYKGGGYGIDIPVANGRYKMQLLVYGGWGAANSTTIDVTADSAGLVADNHYSWG